MQSNELIGWLKGLREYYDAAMANGFTAKEAMEMTLHYQQQVMAAKIYLDQQKNDKPWER